MDRKVATALDHVPLRNLKARARRGEPAVQKVNPEAGAVLNQARFLSGVEPKAMANDAKLSHSLVLRAFKGEGDIGFARLWDAMPDEFWFELGCLILERRGAARVKRLFEIERKSVG